MPAGTRRARDFHDRHARWTAHAYACPESNFKRDLILPSDAYARVVRLNCMVWVDDVIHWGLGETYLLNTLDLILERLEEIGLYAAADKCTFFDTRIT